MDIRELIALASIRSGKKKRELATEMGHADESRVSKIGAGRLKANASELIYLAKQAKLDPIEVLASFEREQHPELASVWDELLSVQAL